MPTFLQSLGWSTATYSSWSHHWKTPRGSENRCPLNILQWSLSAFKQTCGADQDWQIPPRQGPTSQRDRRFLYVPLQPLSSLGFLQALMLSQRTVPASCHVSGSCHLSSAGCFIVTSVSTLFWNHQKLNLISFKLDWKTELFFKSLIGFWQNLPQALFFMASLLLALFSSGWNDREAGKCHKCMKLSESRQILNETEMISFV